ncbi:MAG: hypothetical protein R2795_17875 [Saprospiraceae bacterium]
MKPNDLEQFIAQERAQFDDAFPNLRVWAAIEKEMDSQQRGAAAMPVRRPWYQIAAAVALLLMAGGAGGAYLARQAGQPMAQSIIEDVAPEFSEMERYYNQQIGKRYAQLASFTQDKTLDADLQQIDNAMAELRQELAQVPPGKEEELVHQLMAQYRIKLDLLERILEQIEQFENQATGTTPANYHSSDETNI